MKPLFYLTILVLCSCSNKRVENKAYNINQDSIFRIIKNDSKMAAILFHHSVSKISLVDNKLYTGKSLDSLFDWVGDEIPDSSCSKAGLYSHFGQISFFEDSLITYPIAVLHFVIEGDCKGFYFESTPFAKRYKITPQALTYLQNIYSKNKYHLQ